MLDKYNFLFFFGGGRGRIRVGTYQFGGGRLLIFGAFRVSFYSRWALFRRCTPIRTSTVFSLVINRPFGAYACTRGDAKIATYPEHLLKEG